MFAGGAESQPVIKIKQHSWFVFSPVLMTLCRDYYSLKSCYYTTQECHVRKCFKQNSMRTTPTGLPSWVFSEGSIISVPSSYTLCRLYVVVWGRPALKSQFIVSVNLCISFFYRQTPQLWWSAHHCHIICKLNWWYKGWYCAKYSHVCMGTKGRDPECCIVRFLTERTICAHPVWLFVVC